MKKHLSKIITLALLISFSTVFVKADSFLKAPAATYFEVGFDFQIGNKEFPKGRYKLSRERQSVLILENLNISKTKILLGVVDNNYLSPTYQSKLSFNRYGDTYFLRKVVAPMLTAKVKLTKAEKRIRNATQKKLARITVTNDKTK
jgi:hypothetical protein